MGRKRRHSAEQIIGKLREADVELGKGQSVSQVCRKLEVSEHTYYRWRKEFGGLKVDQAKRLKELERENARLKQVVADQALDNAILREAARGNF
jgi:transposase-like protein